MWTPNAHSGGTQRKIWRRNVIMLVLSRKKNESIVINDDITIVVVEIRGDKVRLGVEAPKEVPVHRREVFDAIHRNDLAGNKAADKTDPAGAGGNT
jgi:carbon storage regulator